MDEDSEPMENAVEGTEIKLKALVSKQQFPCQQLVFPMIVCESRK